MSLSHNPSVTTNGLVMYADMTNTKKSWLGQPTINQFGIPTPDASGYVTFPVQGTSGFQRIYSGTYGGYEIQPTDIVYKYVLGAGPTACHFHGYTINVTTGQTPTWSFDYYIDPSTTGYPVTNYLANMESSINVGGALTDPTPSIIGVWKRATQTSVAATSNGTFNAYLYPGACGTQMATGGFILYKNPQVEFNSFATPFVAGTRASTGAIVDLTGQNTLTATSLTYASDNTSFSFNGSSSGVQSQSTTISFASGVTMEAVFKSTDLASRAQGILDFVGAGSQGASNYINIYLPGNGKVRWEVIANYPNGNISLTSYYSATTLANNTWYHICCTQTTAGAGVIYINGVSDATATFTSPLYGTITSNIRIGLYAGYFSGNIPVAKLYNRALTASEVNQNFNALRGRYSL